MNLQTPLDYYLSRAWLQLNGKERLWHAISTQKFSLIFDPKAPDRVIDDSKRNRVLNDSIMSIVTYRDSVAVILSKDGNDYLLSYCWIENGRWVNGGQDFSSSKDGLIDKCIPNLRNFHADIPRIEMIANVPDDLTPFIEFVKNIKDSPEKFLFNKLKEHRLVINGEYHRRKVSWDMLKRLIYMDGFPDVAGTVFLEDPAWLQFKMDEFMESDTLNVEIVYDIFRDSYSTGWFDRGQFEFLCELWKLNHSLPSEKRIEVVLTDCQPKFSRLRTKDDVEYLDRDECMAKSVFNYLSSSTDKRSSIFLVGCAHANKPGADGYEEAIANGARDLTAGARLRNLLGAENVFTVFQHSMSGDNNGRNKAPIRGGVFDYAFEQDDNRPIGFDLKNSPFGKEPFDGFYERKYMATAGTYYDNYDGYLFLHSLADEPRNTPLLEIYTEEFVEELKRRAEILGTSDQPGYWLGRKAKDLTLDYIKSVLVY